MNNDAEPRAELSLPGWPQYTDEEIAAVESVLRSGRVNYWSGDECTLFEKEFADYSQTSHAIALANGSVALDLAMKVLDIGENDEVVVTPRSFFASAACIELAGARTVFADVDPNSQNITAESIERVLTPKSRMIICVHLAGWPCDMPAITDLAEKRGLFVVEDCAQAHGAKTSGRPVGSWGNAAIFSFCQDKIVTTGGEGGMLLTNDRETWKKAWSFKDHGKSYAKTHSSAFPPGFRWLHDSFGTNYRMTEMQAAIGRCQLRKLDDWVAKRRQNARLLDDTLEKFSCIRTTRPGNGMYHSYYKYYAFVRSENLRPGWDRDRILAEIASRGLPGLSGSCPEIYREIAFAEQRNGGFPRLPIARELGETSIQLLVHPTLDDEHMKLVAAILEGVLERAQRP